MRLSIGSRSAGMTTLGLPRPSAVDDRRRVAGAVVRLKDFDSPATRAALRKSARDEREEVRVAATYALDQMSDPTDRP
jgi:hypothetical protein